MTSLRLVACLAVLVAACQTAATPTATPSASAPGGPVGPGAPRQWSVYSSDIKGFSLQLPSDWEVRPGIESEGILLQINGGADGRILLMEDPLQPSETFQSYAKRCFEAFLADNPDAIEYVELESGRAAHSTTVVRGAMTAYYLYPPAGGLAKVLSFTWDHAEPNPVWRSVAERFNPHSPELIVPFITPTPGS